MDVRPCYARGVTTARRVRHSYADYLAALELSVLKLEYCEGEIYAMAGGTPAHADLAASMIRLLSNVLVGRCRVASSDLKVRIEATDLSTFPDVSVVCGARRTSAIDKNAMINPTLLVEITSNSTEEYDRGEKLEHYKKCPSLQGVLFVSHREPRVTVVERTSDGWIEREFHAGQEARVSSPEVGFDVDELYAGIDLDVG
jgi:Uma2 family endonuclease